MTVEPANQPVAEPVSTKAKASGKSINSKNEQSEYREELARVSDGVFEAAAA